MLNSCNWVIVTSNYFDLLCVLQTLLWRWELTKFPFICARWLMCTVHKRNLQVVIVISHTEAESLKRVKCGMFRTILSAQSTVCFEVNRAVCGRELIDHEKFTSSPFGFAKRVPLQKMWWFLCTFPGKACLNVAFNYTECHSKCATTCTC